MCGIICYVGKDKAKPILLEGLKRLEYRGYDSAGMAVQFGGGVELYRAVGKIIELEKKVQDVELPGTCGIAHTRWATHGEPSEENAHPHRDQAENVFVIHNGIIENYHPIRKRLEKSGVRFRSQTDTEVLAHLIETHLEQGGDLLAAVTAALREVRGAYAVAVLAVTAPDRLVVAKHGAGSVVVGLGEGETLVASDIPAILPHTRDIVLLEDGEVAVLSRAGVQITTLAGQPVERLPVHIAWDAAMSKPAASPSSRTIDRDFFSDMIRLLWGIRLHHALNGAGQLII